MGLLQPAPGTPSEGGDDRGSLVLGPPEKLTSLAQAFLELRHTAVVQLLAMGRVALGVGELGCRDRRLCSACLELLPELSLGCDRRCELLADAGKLTLETGDMLSGLCKHVFVGTGHLCSPPRSKIRDQVGDFSSPLALRRRHRCSGTRCL